MFWSVVIYKNGIFLGRSIRMDELSIHRAWSVVIPWTRQRRTLSLPDSTVNKPGKESQPSLMPTAGVTANI